VSARAREGLLRVGLIGGSDRIRARVAAVVERLGRGAVVLVEPPAAEVLLVDLDGPGAAGAWAAHRIRAPAVPAVLLASDAGRLVPGFRGLVKPLAPVHLLAELHAARADAAAQAEPPPAEGQTPAGAPLEETVALARSAGGEPLTERLDPRGFSSEPRLATELCGDLEDVDLDDSSAVARLFLPVEAHLLGVVRLAAEEAGRAGTGWTLQVPGGSLRGTPVGGPVYSTLPSHGIRDLCHRELPSASRRAALAPDGPAALGARQSAAAWESLEAFLWQAALWTYRGRLPSGTAVHGRVYLARWPNLTRLAEVPHGVRIAALWLAQPVSLAFTARTLSVRQRYVFAFYGAAHAVGLAGQARRASDHLFEAVAVRPGEDRRLLTGMVARLRGLVGG
jgi:hypothetical protein